MEYFRRVKDDTSYMPDYVEPDALNNEFIQMIDWESLDWDDADAVVDICEEYFLGNMILMLECYALFLDANDSLVTETNRNLMEFVTGFYVDEECDLFNAFIGESYDFTGEDPEEKNPNEWFFTNHLSYAPYRTINRRYVRKKTQVQPKFPDC